MKNSINIESILIWLSGADKDVLAKCSHSERTKYAGLGSLIIVPALLGTISMSYAISTLNINWFFSGICGTLWGLIVLMIDRFIVSTFKKSNSIIKDIFSASFFIRLIFAIGIGITVSHPLVLRIFDKSINQTLFEERNKEINEIQVKSEGKINELNDQISERRNKVDCLRKLVTSEQSGVRIELDCGFSSGLLGYSTRSKTIESQIEKLNEEINSLKKENNFEINKIDSLKTQKINQFNENFSTDYLSRTTALAKLEKKESGVAAVKLFLLLFFIFVDILPVIFKALLQKGQYEFILEEEEELRLRLLMMKHGDKELFVKVMKDNEAFRIDEIKREYFNIKEVKNQISITLSEVDKIRTDIRTKNFKDAINVFFGILELNYLKVEQDILLKIASKIKYLQTQIDDQTIDIDLANREINRLADDLEELVVNTIKGGRVTNIPNKKFTISLEEQNNSDAK